MIKLEKNPTGISTVKDNASIFGVSATETGCRIDASTPQRVTVYSLDGKTVWTGQVPATVELERGMYVVRSESGDYVKVKFSFNDIFVSLQSIYPLTDSYLLFIS